jgi:hypothetical protein
LMSPNQQSIPEAPIGHRQPRVDQVPSEKNLMDEQMFQRRRLRSRAIRPSKVVFIWQAILAAQHWLFPSA